MTLKIIIFLFIISFIYTIIAIFVEFVEQNKKLNLELFLRTIKELFLDFSIFKKFFFTLEKNKSRELLSELINRESILSNNTSEKYEEVYNEKITERLNTLTIEKLLKSSYFLSSFEEDYLFCSESKDGLLYISKTITKNLERKDKINKKDVEKIKYFFDENYGQKVTVN